jgi:hypothetical protein
MLTKNIIVEEDLSTMLCHLSLDTEPKADKIT